MARRDIIVVGASAGGVEALQQFAAGLPADYAGSVFVVLHVRRDGISTLPTILDRAGPLPARHARDGEAIQPGVIMVAPPDRHLVLHRGRVRLPRGPRENGFRPSVDVLFRSAARAYGSRVIGVVLSGALDDGAAGLLDIKQRGGLALVQDPAEALVSSMPASALDAVAVDACLPARALGAHASALLDVDAAPVAEKQRGVPDEEMGIESAMAELEGEALHRADRPGTPSTFGCPSCGGVLWQMDEDDPLRFRCRVGHGFTAESLDSHISESLEEALWMALRALEEKAELSERLARRMERQGFRLGAERFVEAARDARQRAEVVRRLLLNGSKAAPEGDNQAGPRAAAEV